PQIGRFDANGFCGEELKIIHETKKILDLPELRVSAFTVRVPVMNAHSEAVWVTLKEKASYSDLSKAFHSQSGLVPTLEDSSNYPTALNSSSQKDTFIGRLHQDLEDPQTWLFWVVADNILKGAAWNGLQIAQKIFLS
ncbi:MAG: aspartate-semialdehyde dehydrogenase, partial [Bdellovibrio sp.]